MSAWELCGGGPHRTSSSIAADVFHATGCTLLTADHMARRALAISQSADELIAGLAQLVDDLDGEG